MCLLFPLVLTALLATGWIPEVENDSDGVWVYRGLLSPFDVELNPIHRVKLFIDQNGCVTGGVQLFLDVEQT